MKKVYGTPSAGLWVLSKEDIMTNSPGFPIGGGGTGEFLDKLINNGVGNLGLEIDINDHLNGLS